MFDLNFPFAQGVPLARAILKQSPEDFVVDEVLPFEPSGAGEHVLLQIRKTGLNTQDVVKHIRQVTGISERQISYAGLKDKHAITSQWFSVQQSIKLERNWQEINTEQIALLSAVRHSRKLQRGTISHNRFQIVLRELTGDVQSVTSRIQHVGRHGVPNYFGIQRFGTQGRNLAAARDYFAGSLQPGRFQRSMYLSAARAWIFNTVLAHRLVSATWDKALAGDTFWLEGTKRFFHSEHVDATLLQRVAEHDIHPTGPLWGKGELQSQSAVRELEYTIAAQSREFCEGLAAQGLEHDRRSLRVMLTDLQYWVDIPHSKITLSFSLPAGCYATSVLRELVNLPETIDTVPDESTST